MPRLPSSLKWLIDRRGRVDGEIKKIEASLAKCQKLAETLEDLKMRLASIDQTLDLHEIKVDPRYIPTIRSHDIRVNLPHGELTRGILLYLRLNEGHPSTTYEITSFVAARYADLNAESTDYSSLKVSVRYRLKNLRRSGIVKGHHKDNSGGLWSLVIDSTAN